MSEENTNLAALESCKITVKETETIEKDIDIQLPCFVRYSIGYFYKIISQNKMIKVVLYPGDNSDPSVSLLNSITPAFDTHPYFFISEEEFNSKYSEAMNQITEKSGITIEKQIS